MTEHTWCPVCNGHILIIEEEPKGICSWCASKKHANNFHKKFDHERRQDNGRDSKDMGLDTRQSG